jgi:hypothetical protein
MGPSQFEADQQLREPIGIGTPRRSTLSATSKGNGYQATVIFPDDDVSISSAETYPTIAEAMDRAEPLTTP